MTKQGPQTHTKKAANVSRADRAKERREGTTSGFHRQAGRAEDNSSLDNTLATVPFEQLLKDSLFSEQVAQRLKDKLHKHDEQQALRNQLQELCDLYSFHKAIGVFGLKGKGNNLLYHSLADTLKTMMGCSRCQILQEVLQTYEEQYFQSLGCSEKLGTKEGKGSRVASTVMIGLSPSQPAQIELLARQVTPLVMGVDEVHALFTSYHVSLKGTQFVMVAPVRSVKKHRLMGFFLFETDNATGFNEEEQRFALEATRLYAHAQELQRLTEEAQRVITQQQPPLPAQPELNARQIGQLVTLRASLSEIVSEFTLQQQTFAETLSAMVDARDHHSRGYSLRVAALTQWFATQLNLNEKTRELLYFAGLLGSIGKFSIPRQLLHRKERLTQKDWDLIENHPNIGVHLLMQMSFLTEIIPFVSYQRERWDGEGVPEGLKGYSIPLGARILGICNAYVGLTQARSYREAPLSHTEALSVLQDESGKRWDPMLVELLSHFSEALS